jgi:hypothetical protein
MIFFHLSTEYTYLDRSIKIKLSQEHSPHISSPSKKSRTDSLVKSINSPDDSEMNEE